MKTKICGLNPTRDVQLCIDLKVNYLGFVFYEKSPRNINILDIKNFQNMIKILLLSLSQLTQDEFIKKNIIGNFDFIQLHGSETRDRVAELRAWV